MADIKSILDASQVPNQVKADAWDAYHSAGDPQAFQQSFDKIALPKDVKAQLWDSKFAIHQDHTPGVFDHIANAAKNFWGELSNMGQGMVDMATTNPITTLKNIGAAQDALRVKALDAIHRGDYVEAARHALDYAVPVQGPAIDARGDQAQSGDVSGALGGAAAIGAVNALPGVLHANAPAIADAAETAAKVPSAVVEGVKAGAPDVLAGAAKAGAGLAASEVLPGPMRWPARAVAVYPGYKQVRGGFNAGFEAFRDALAKKAATVEAPAAAPEAPAPAPSPAPNPSAPASLQDVIAPAEAPKAVSLDELSQALAGKNFNKLDPNGQATVRDLAARANAPAPQSAPTPQPTATTAQPTPVPQTAPPASLQDVVSPAAPKSVNPEFSGWFGDSKVVDESGNPEVVYHGTTHAFDDFQHGVNKTDEGYLGKGFYFGDSKTANIYAGTPRLNKYGEQYNPNAQQLPGGNVHPVYLKMEHPLNVDAEFVDSRPGAPPREIDRAITVKKALGLDSSATSEQVTEEAKKQGYDGVIYNYKGSKEYAAFSPDQIRPAVGKPHQYSLAEMLRDEMLRSGTATPDQVAPVQTPEPVAVPQAALDKGFRSMPAESRVTAADANHRAQVESNGQNGVPSGQAYQAAYRANKVGTLADSFEQNGISASMAKLASGPEFKADWAKVAHSLGIKPPSAATIAQVVEELERREAVAKR